MPTFETNLPVKPVTGSNVVRTPLVNALANPLTVLNPGMGHSGVTIQPIPPGGVFQVPLGSGGVD